MNWCSKKMAYLLDLLHVNLNSFRCIWTTTIPEKGGYVLWISSRLDYALLAC
jgi:hypothetical protein